MLSIIRSDKKGENNGGLKKRKLHSSPAFLSGSFRYNFDGFTQICRGKHLVLGKTI